MGKVKARQKRKRGPQPQMVPHSPQPISTGLPTITQPPPGNPLTQLLRLMPQAVDAPTWEAVGGRSDRAEMNVTSGGGAACAGKGAENVPAPALVKFEDPRTGPRCMVGKLAGWNATPQCRITKPKPINKKRA
jgi:hypothetical protein